MRSGTIAFWISLTASLLLALGGAVGFYLAFFRSPDFQPQTEEMLLSLRRKINPDQQERFSMVVSGRVVFEDGKQASFTRTTGSDGEFREELRFSDGSVRMEDSRNLKAEEHARVMLLSALSFPAWPLPAQWDSFSLRRLPAEKNAGTVRYEAEFASGFPLQGTAELEMRAEDFLLRSARFPGAALEILAYTRKGNLNIPANYLVRCRDRKARQYILDDVRIKVPESVSEGGK